MVFNCPECQKDFLFPKKLLDYLIYYETFTRNPAVKIICRPCGYALAATLPRRKP